MNLRPTLALGALAFAAIVGVAFALDATLGTPTAHASGPDREIDDPWIEDPPEKSEATIQCWIVIKESNVEGSNICSPGAYAKSYEKSARSGGGSGGDDGNDGHDGDEGNTTETTVCYSKGVLVSQQCDVDGDADNHQTFVGLPLYGMNGATYEEERSAESVASEPGEGGDSEKTLCFAEGEMVSQQCDVDGDASSKQLFVGLPLLRGPIQLV